MNRNERRKEKYHEDQEHRTHLLSRARRMYYRANYAEPRQRKIMEDAAINATFSNLMSAEDLALAWGYEVATILDYVKRGILPTPQSRTDKGAPLYTKESVICMSEVLREHFAAYRYIRANNKALIDKLVRAVLV